MRVFTADWRRSMRRLRRATAVGLAAAALAGGAAAEPSAWVSRVGILIAGPAADVRVQALKDELRELGYVEGHNRVVVQRWTGAQRERLPALAAEIAAAQVDVIVAIGLAT